MLQGISPVNTDWPAHVCGTAYNRGLIQITTHTDHSTADLLWRFDMCPNVPYGYIYIYMTNRGTECKMRLNRYLVNYSDRLAPEVVCLC